jgi:hypothetical protein
MKIRPVGVVSFHADKQTNRKTDVTELIIALRNSATTPLKAGVLHTVVGRRGNEER